MLMSPNPFEVAQDLKYEEIFEMPLQIRPELFTESGLAQAIPTRESDNCDFGAHNLITSD